MTEKKTPFSDALMPLFVARLGEMRAEKEVKRTAEKETNPASFLLPQLMEKLDEERRRMIAEATPQKQKNGVTRGGHTI